MVACDNLDKLARAIVEDDEIFKKIDKVALVAYPLQEGFHIHDARFILIKAFPFMEMFVPAGQRADFGVHSVGKNDDGVMMKEMRYSVLVIREVLFVCSANIFMDVFQFHDE